MDVYTESFAMQLKSNKKRKVRNIPSIFQDTFEDPEEQPLASTDIKGMLYRKAMVQRSKEEETLISEYDESKDESIPLKSTKTPSEGPKYIHKMMQAAFDRKQQQESAYNRRIIKEQEEIAPDTITERFITKGYKEKLANDLRIQQEQVERSKRVESCTVETSGSSFNLLQNILDTRTRPVSAIDSPTRRSKIEAARERYLQRKQNEQI